jgi:hypothetical protein
MQKQKMHLSPENILKFFLGSDDEIDTLIKCKGSEIDFETYDCELYEALGCLKDYDNFKLNKLIKFLEVVDVLSYRRSHYKEKPILTHERVDELRKKALKKK